MSIRFLLLRSLVLLLFALTLYPSNSISVTYVGVSNINGNANCTQGNGQVVTKDRDLSSFKQISITGAFKVFITYGATQKISVTAENNIIPLITSTVTGKTLFLTSNAPICTKLPMKIDITVPELIQINSTGANKIIVQCDPAYGSLEISLSGASKLTLTGHGEAFTAKLHGASKLYANNAIIKNATILTKGASVANVTVLQSLKAESGGASKIFYNSSVANIKKTTSGAGEILPLSQK